MNAEQKGRSSTWILLVILAFALALRVIWLTQVNTQPVTDFDWYFERGREMATGLTYQFRGAPTAYWPVGYPYALSLLFAVFGAKVTLAKILNTVLVLGSIALAWWIAKKLSSDARVAHGVALILAIQPAYIAYCGILASEPLYTFLTLLGIVLCLIDPKSKAWQFLAAGVIFGFATLVRPQAVLIPLIVLVFGSFFRDPAREVRSVLRKGLFLYLALGLTLLPWTARNYVTFGKFVFVSTNGGDNLWIGNNPVADGKYHNPETLGLAIQGLPETERDSITSRAAKDYIRSNFGKVVSLWPAKLTATFLSGTDAPYWAFQKVKGVLSIPGKGDDKSLYKGFQSYSIFCTSGLLWLSILALPILIWKRQFNWLCISLTLYNGLIVMMFFGNARFSFPVLPFLAMIVCQGVFALLPAKPEPIPESQS